MPNPAAVIAVVLAQASGAFSPNLPASIPVAEGKVTEPFALRYIDVSAGSGEPAAAGQRYTVHYTGWLRDGRKFDSSRDRNEPFQFVQGRRQVIAGWETGFEGMRAGGKRRLFLPYQLAYGEKGNASIPPRAELIFDVELLRVETVADAPAGADVLDALAGLEKKVMTLARSVPESKWDARPAPAVRSFREVLLHIAYGTRLMTDLAAKFPEMDAFRARVEKQWRDEKEPHDAARVIAMLGESFAYARQAIEPLRAGQLGADTRFFESTTTRRGVYINLTNHVSEHLGQLIVYARLAGVTPPWSN